MENINSFILAYINNDIDGIIKAILSRPAGNPVVEAQDLIDRVLYVLGPDDTIELLQSKLPNYTFSIVSPFDQLKVLSICGMSCQDYVLYNQLVECIKNINFDEFAVTDGASIHIENTDFNDRVKLMIANGIDLQNKLNNHFINYNLIPLNKTSISITIKPGGNVIIRPAHPINDIRLEAFKYADKIAGPKLTNTNKFTLEPGIVCKLTLPFSTVWLEGWSQKIIPSYTRYVYGISKKDENTMFIWFDIRAHNAVMKYLSIPDSLDNSAKVLVREYIELCLN